MALTTDDLITHVQTSLGPNTTKKAAKEAIQAVLGGIAGELQANAKDLTFEYRLHGFGTFKIKDVPAKTGHNPQTGAAVDIARRTKPTFKFTKSLADLGK